MRVLTFTPSYPRFEGDYHGRFIRDLCDRLVEKGVDVGVLAPRSRTQGELGQGARVKRFPYLPTRRLEFLAERTMKGAPLGSLLQLPAYLTSAYIHLLKEEAAIVHAHLAIPFGSLAAMDPRRLPLLVTCHGSGCTLPYTNPPFRPAARWTLKRADRVVAVSEFVKRVATKIGAPPKRVEVVYTGVDTDRFAPPAGKRRMREALGIPDEALVVGALGRLVPGKRVGDIIEAVGEVSRSIDVHLLVGGDGPMRAHLEDVASKKGAQVTFLGEVFDAPRFHQACDVFALASVREGLSVALQEAMASGCVPVAAEGFGCTEVIEEGVNGFLFKPRCVESLSIKIREAASNLGLGKAARETIEEGFDLDRGARRYLEIYRELAGGGPAS